MKQIIAAGISVIIAATSYAQQRTVAECTVTYAITAEDSTDQAFASSIKASTKTVYIKANQSRVDLVSPSFSQSVIYDKSSGTAVILRDISGNKLISKLDNARWKTENERYDGATLSTGAETKTILGYECRRATLQLKDGGSFIIYYATNIIPSVKEFEYQFRDVPGFVLEYEAQDQGGKKILYTATKINLNPVSTVKFDIPTSGYRLLN